MSDTCYSCCKCAGLNGSLNLDHSFAKKLLVAISIVVLLSMCVMPAQARSVGEHKMRHKQASAAETKEMMMPNKLELSSVAKRKKNIYRDAITLIFKQVKHSYTCYNNIRNNLSDYSTLNRGKPDWLPRTNYRVIHYKNYSESRNIWEQKFKFIMPRLYRSLKMYEFIFTALKGATLQAIDTKFDLYWDYRQEFLKNLIVRIQIITDDIEENLQLFKLAVPSLSSSMIKTDSLLNVPYPSQLIRNDYIALRGFGKTISNWYCELYPGKPPRKSCVQYAKRLNRRPDGNLG